MSEKVKNIAQELYDNMTGPGADPMKPSDKRALDLGMQLLCLALDSFTRIADACERSAAAAEGVRPAHDPLDGL